MSLCGLDALAGLPEQVRRRLARLSRREERLLLGGRKRGGLKKTPDNLVEDFWMRVRLGKPDECWPYTGAVGDHGYGQARTADGIKMTAHRFAYMSVYGHIPGDLIICHKCDNRPCCNPRHLFAGSQKDNIRDAASKGRLIRRKVSREDVLAMRALYAEGNLDQKAIGKLYGLTQSAAWRILRRKNWAWVETWTAPYTP